jgi:dipeptidyl-peptidase-4
MPTGRTRCRHRRRRREDAGQVGTASWVYGEEPTSHRHLVVSDSKKIAFYRFDESRVPDFFSRWTRRSFTARPISKPIPGEPNPSSTS